MSKKQAIIIICTVLTFWTIVIVLLFLRNTKASAEEVTEIGELSITYPEDPADYYPFETEDRGWVMVFDNYSLLAKEGFITTKGHVFFNATLTEFLWENGIYLETVSLMDESVKQEGAYSYFSLLLTEHSPDRVDVVFDRISEKFEYSLVPIDKSLK